MSLAHAVYRERLCRLHCGCIELCASRVASRHIFSHTPLFFGNIFVRPVYDACSARILTCSGGQVLSISADECHTGDPLDAECITLAHVVVLYGMLQIRSDSEWLCGGVCFWVDWYSVGLGTLYLTPRLFALSLLTNMLPGPSTSEVTTTLWLYTNLFIIIIIIF